MGEWLELRGFVFARRLSITLSKQRFIWSIHSIPSLLRIYF